MGIAYGVNPVWAKETNAGRTHIATKGVYSNNIVFNLDFGSNSCYSGTGTSVTDLTGSYTGTLTNGPSYSSAEYGGIVLDGVDDYIGFGNLGASSNVSVSNNFTIEQVFKPTNYQSGAYYGLTNMLLVKGSATTYNYATQISSDTTVAFIKRTTGGEALQFNTFTVPSMLFKPTVITFVVTSGTSGSGTVACYHNGALIGSQTIAGSGIAAGTSDPFQIGTQGTANTAFIGTYYSGRIYSTSLTADNVLKNFNVIKGRFGL